MIAMTATAAIPATRGVRDECDVALERPASSSDFSRSWDVSNRSSGTLARHRLMTSYILWSFGNSVRDEAGSGSAVIRGGWVFWINATGSRRFDGFL